MTKAVRARYTLLELAVANLLQDVRIAGFIDLEGLAAVRADDLVHVFATPAFEKTAQTLLERIVPATTPQSGHATAHLGLPLQFASSTGWRGWAFFAEEHCDVLPHSHGP